MSALNILLAEANPEFKIVKVIFERTSTDRLQNTNREQKTYTYKTVLPVVAGDLVVVDVNGKFKVVEAAEVINASECDLSFSFEVKWLVSKVDLEHYETCKQSEREANSVINKAKYSKQRKELLSTLEEVAGSAAIEAVKGLVRL